MKECNKQFFSDKGITSSSANHLANIAKETAEQIKSELNNINFLKTTVSLLGSKDPQLIKDGISNEDLETIQDKLQVVIEANAFIAWVREAIKAKDDEITAIKSMSVESYYSDVLQLGVMDSELLYPKEIKIGEVISVEEDKIKVMKSAIVKPYVDFNKLEELFIVSPKDTREIKYD